MSDAKRTYSPRKLRPWIEIARAASPDLQLETDEQIRAAMGEHLPSIPGKTHFNEVVNGKRNLSPTFLRALHRAFRLDRASLREDIWMEGDGGADGAQDGALARFRERIEAARRTALAPLGWVRSMVTHAKLPLMLEGGLLGLGTGDAIDKTSAQAPRVPIGHNARLATALPARGYVTFFNFQADESYTEPLVHWIDPALQNVRRLREPGVAVLPEKADGVPVAGPPGPNTLVAVFTEYTPKYFWPISTGLSMQVSEADLRRFLLQIDGAGDPTSRVGVLDYVVFEAGG